MSNPRPQKRKCAIGKEFSHPTKRSQPSSTITRTPELPPVRRPIRARIFRNGKSYIPPVVEHAPAGPSFISSSSLDSHPAGPSNLAPPVASKCQSNSNTPTPSSAVQEAWRLDFPPDRLLTDLQKVDRHVRLLLPKDATIVLPSTTPPRLKARHLAVPEPDPSLWVGNYVSIPSTKLSFNMHLLLISQTMPAVTMSVVRLSIICLGWMSHPLR